MMAKEKRHNSLILVPCASTPATNACTSVIRRTLLSGRSHLKVQKGEGGGERGRGEGEGGGEEEVRMRKFMLYLQLLFINDVNL